MRAGVIGLVWLAFSAGVAAAQTPAPSTPTPATRGRNPGAAATDAVTSPSRPPAEVAPRTQAPTAPVAAAPSPAASGPMSNQEMREMLEAARATAKATREAVDYGRVVPDILTQILAKLDKLEDKLDKVETAVKASAPPGRRREAR